MSFALTRDSTARNSILSLSVWREPLAKILIPRSKCFTIPQYLKLRLAEIWAIFKLEYFHKTICRWHNLVNSKLKLIQHVPTITTNKMIREAKNLLPTTWPQSLIKVITWLKMKPSWWNSLKAWWTNFKANLTTLKCKMIKIQNCLRTCSRCSKKCSLIKTPSKLSRTLRTHRISWTSKI